MNDSEVVEVCRTGHDLRELSVFKDWVGIHEETGSGLTNRKWFAFRLAPVNPTTFPFCIQWKMVRKLWGSAEKETPDKGKTEGRDRRFQPMVSR